MTTEVVCRSTRYGAGCGHPVTDHDGNPARDCCCCNWQHNDPDHARDCIHCHARRIKAQLGGAATMGEIAPHMPEHLVKPFWRWAVERYLKLDAAQAEAECPYLADVLAGRAQGPHDDSACGHCANLRRVRIRDVPAALDAARAVQREETR